MAARYFSMIAVLAFISLAAVNPCAAQQRGPSTPEERGRFVNLTRALESDPLNEKAADARRWLFTWLAEVPDISVTVCADFLKPLMGKDKDKNYGSEIFGQSMYGSATFIIEHPDQATDDEAIHVAGLESALRAYESILKSKPKAKWPLLDSLIEKRGKDELDDYVRDILSKGNCKGKK